MEVHLRMAGDSGLASKFVDRHWVPLSQSHKVGGVTTKVKIPDTHTPLANVGIR